MRTCPYCHNEHPDEAKFCPATGQEFPPQPAAFCGNCGTAVRPDWKICVHCGSPLGAGVVAATTPASRAKRTWMILIAPALLLAFALYWLVSGSPRHSVVLSITSAVPVQTQEVALLARTTETQVPVSIISQTPTVNQSPSQVPATNSPVPSTPVPLLLPPVNMGTFSPTAIPVSATPGIQIIAPVPTPIAWIAYGDDLKREIFLQNIFNGEKVQVTSNSYIEDAPSFSPDNNRIVFASYRANGWELYISDLKKKTEAQITTTDMQARFPKWSPVVGDERIVFEGVQPPEKGKGSSVWMVNADGTGMKELTKSSADSRPHWSPDGKNILFGRALKDTSGDGKVSSADNLDLFILDLETNLLTQVANTPNYDDYNFTWSRDGKWIAFGSVRKDTNGDGFQNLNDAVDLFILPSDGKGSERRVDLQGKGPFAPDWSPDDRQIIFTAYFSSTRQEIWTVDVETNALKKITGLGPYFHPEWMRQVDAD